MNLRGASGRPDYEAIVEHAPFGIYRSTRAGRFLYVNPAIVRMLGYPSREALLAVPVESVYADPHERERLIEAVEEANRIERVVVEWRRADGTLLTVRLSGRVLRPVARGETVLEVFVEDITELKRLEVQLLQAQKMEAIGRLAGGIAHDFNNILTVISGYAELLCARLEESSGLHQAAREMALASEKGATLTRQLLAFSRRQIVRPQALDLNEILVQLEPMVRRLIGEDIELAVIPGSGLWTVRCDPAQIEQAVLNLAVNARDAMPAGGRLCIETMNVELDEAYARGHAAVVPGSYVCLAVSDTGVGMDEATRERAFEPFFTTKPAGVGTGLGLASVYGVVKQNGGYVWIYSEPGQGTTVKIYLPRVEEAARPVPARSRDEGALRGGTEILWLVEDDEGVREIMARSLEEAGYRVEVFGSAAEVLQRPPARQPPSLLITDVVMPGASGKVLVGSLREHWPELRVLYVSGYTDNAIALRGALDPGVDLLEKPFSPRQLLRRVREILDR